MRAFADIERYQTILANRAVLDSVIKRSYRSQGSSATRGRRTSWTNTRRSRGGPHRADIVVFLSRTGTSAARDWTVPLRARREGLGRRPPGRDGASIVAVTSTHKDVYLFTSLGRVLGIRGHMTPEFRTGKGRLIGRIVPLDEGETVVSMYGRSLEGKEYVFFATRKGMAKRLPLSEIARLNRAGKRVLSLRGGDEIAQVRLTGGEDELLFMTRKGRGLRVLEDEFRPMGRTAMGVQAMRLAKDDELIACEVVQENRSALVISSSDSARGPLSRSSPSTTEAAVG